MKTVNDPRYTKAALIDAVKRQEALKAELKEIDNYIKSANDIIKALVSTSGEIKLSGVTVDVKVVESNQIDATELAKKMPDVYNKFLKPVKKYTINYKV